MRIHQPPPWLLGLGPELACDYAQLRADEAGMSEPQRLYGHLADHLRDPVLEPTVSPTVGRRRRR